MTCKGLFEISMQLANTTDSLGNVNAAETSDLSRAMVVFVNQIYADMWRLYNSCCEFKPIEFPEDVLLIPEIVVRDVMAYGVAMLICNRIGDVNGYDTFAVMYNRKRGSIATRMYKEDVLPGVVDDWG